MSSAEIFTKSAKQYEESDGHLQTPINIFSHYFFLFLHENICCGYSLEVLLCGAEYHNICLHGEIRKPQQ